MEAMELEHCAKYGHDIKFTAPNYLITTTPEEEWAIVVHNAPTQNLGHGRRIKPIKELMKEDLVAKTNMIEAEVVAVVHYTGPLVCAPLPLCSLCFALH